MENTIDERVHALHGAFNALLVTLHEAGVLDTDRLRLHLRGAANQIESGGLPEIAAALDQMREHLDVLLPQQSPQTRSS